jgi:hypothetical protein
MIDNKVSQTYTAAMVQTATTKIADIRAAFPGLLTLKPEERAAYLNMGERTVPFVQKALDYAARNAAFVPSFVSIPELTKDFTAAQFLLQVSKQITELQNAIDDTLLVAAALAIYKNIQQSASHGVAGAQEAADDMSTRFLGHKAPKSAASKQN